MEPITIVALLGGASTFTMFAALVRQTMRAERAERALERVEAVIAERIATPLDNFPVDKLSNAQCRMILSQRGRS